MLGNPASPFLWRTPGRVYITIRVRRYLCPYLFWRWERALCSRISRLSRISWCGHHSSCLSNGVICRAWNIFPHCALPERMVSQSDTEIYQSESAETRISRGALRDGCHIYHAMALWIQIIECGGSGTFTHALGKIFYVSAHQLCYLGGNLYKRWLFFWSNTEKSPRRHQEIQYVHRDRGYGSGISSVVNTGCQEKKMTIFFLSTLPSDLHLRV